MNVGNETILYEIDDAKNVLRMITFHVSGEIVRETLAEDPLASISLLEDEFPMENQFAGLSVGGIQFYQLAVEDFEREWAQAR